MESFRDNFAHAHADCADADLKNFYKLLAWHSRDVLTLIYVLVDQMSRGGSGPIGSRALSQLGQVKTSARKIGHVIDILLEGRDWVDCNSLMRDLLGQQSGFSQRAIDARVGALPVILGQEKSIYHLFESLFCHSLGFSPINESCRIAVSALDRGEWWEFTILNENANAPASSLHSCMESTIKIKDQETTKGADLGLAICHKLVEMQNGRIWSEVLGEKGFAFKFTWPKELQDPFQGGLKNAAC